MSFTVGDVVILKSGGPMMTVTAAFNREQDGSPWVKVYWLSKDGSDCSNSEFPAELLKHYERPAVAARAGKPRKIRNAGFSD